MKRLTVSDIENAFLPSKEIDNADRFAGRVDEVNNAYFALHSSGTNIAIIGNRGIGKTSLARQIVNLANGDNELLNKLGLPYEDRLDFLSMYYACDNSVSNCQELLERLLTKRDCLSDWIYDIPAARREIESLDPKVDAKLLSVAYSSGSTDDFKSSISAHSINTVFTNVLSAMAAANLAENGILIVIDEFDQIRDSSGFASIMKSLATNVSNVKFCIVGVAQDIRNLMKEHESTDRLFAGSIIHLHPMFDEELIEIIENAEASLEKEITFTQNAKERIVNLAQGHPYMVHLLGKYALHNAYASNEFEISIDDIDDTLRGIAERAADPVLEGRYKQCISASPQRESVLRAMAGAQRSDGEIYTSDAYTVAINQYGVDNPSQYVGQLGSEDYGAEIEKVRERYYRFKDSLFHAYVLARPKYFDQ